MPVIHWSEDMEAKGCSQHGIESQNEREGEQVASHSGPVWWLSMELEGKDEECVDLGIDSFASVLAIGSVLLE